MRLQTPTDFRRIALRVWQIDQALFAAGSTQRWCTFYPNEELLYQIVEGSFIGGHRRSKLLRRVRLPTRITMVCPSLLMLGELPSVGFDGRPESFQRLRLMWILLMLPVPSEPIHTIRLKRTWDSTR